MVVADPLESGDVTIVCITALLMGVAAAIEFTADIMGVAELIGDAADITGLLMGVMETLELVVGEVTLVMDVVVVVTINNDATLVLAGMVGGATAELLIGGISVVL